MQKKENNLHKQTWIFTTYFAEGFPYTIIRTLSSLFFRDIGMSLQGLGVTSIFGLPWVLKFLWGPLIDTYGTKRKWLLLTEAILCLIMIAVALTVHLSTPIIIISLIFFLGSFAASTHDIAIDGFYMEALSNEDQAKFVGYRVMAYRIAMMTGTGVIATVGAFYGWPTAFFLAAVTMIALLVIHKGLLPKCEQQTQPISAPSWLFLQKHILKLTIISGALGAIFTFFRSESWKTLQSQLPILQKLTFPALISLCLFLLLIGIWLFRSRINAIINKNPESFYAKSFLSFMDRDKIGAILAFILFIRTGEYMLSAMYSPFMVDLGLKAHYGWISAGIGLPASIIGALSGGWCLSRYGLKKMALPFLLLQNVSNVVYMFLALQLSDIIAVNTGNPIPQALTGLQMASVVIVHAFDQLSGGLGTAVLMTFLMRICRQKYKAAHYAIGTGVMSVSGLYAGVLSGFIASWTGYGYFFGISFLASIPGMLMLFWVPLFEE